MDFKPARRLRSHVGAVLCARFTKDGQYALTCGADRTVKLWNPAREAPDTGALLIKTYQGAHSKEISQVAVADDGARFASCGGDTSAFVWDVATGRAARRLEGHAARVNCVCFCAPGHALVATGSYDQTVRFWDLRSQSRHALQVLDDFGDSVTSLAIARGSADPRGGKRQPPADHALVAGCVDGRVRTYDLRKGRVHADALGAPVTSVAVSRDGACVAASCLDGSARLLEVDSGTQLNLYSGHEHANFALESCFAHNDAHLASGSEDGRVVIWRLVEATVAAELKGVHRSAAATLSWHPKRAALLVGSHDGTASFWEAGS